MTSYNMSERSHQKLQIGDEDGATLIGGSGAWDTLIAGNGNDCMLRAGSGGHQLLMCGNGRNATLIGGSGADDTLVGGDAGSIFRLGTGAHQLARGGAGDDAFFVNAFGASDTIDGGGGKDTVYFELHDSQHVQMTRNNASLTLVFTDIGRTMVLKNIEVIKFSDGKTI